MNELHCDGVRLTFATQIQDLETAVRELESRLAYFGIEAELSGMMRLCDKNGKTLEVC